MLQVRHDSGCPGVTFRQDMFLACQVLALFPSALRSERKSGLSLSSTPSPLSSVRATHALLVTYIWDLEAWSSTTLALYSQIFQTQSRIQCSHYRTRYRQNPHVCSARSNRLYQAPRNTNTNTIAVEAFKDHLLSEEGLCGSVIHKAASHTMMHHLAPLDK